MSGYIPSDVWVDILVKLPVEKLIQCCFVCKSWYFLITSHAFITKHLNYTTQFNNNGFLLSRHYVHHKFHYALHFDDDKLDKFIKLKAPFDSEDNRSYVGCSNGIICLVERLNGTLKFCIWNPLIRKTLFLPEHDLLLPSSQIGNCFFGFWFDGVRDDYVVVGIFDQLSPSLRRVVQTRVEIYRLSTGSWKSLCYDPPNYYLITNYAASPPVLNDAVHWLSTRLDCHPTEFDNLIVAFDMRNEVFKEIMLPEKVANIHPYYLGFGALDSSLALVEHERYSFSYCLISVMMEYGIRESWTRLYTIDLRAITRTFLGFGRRNEVILYSSRPGMYSYDLKTKQLSSLGISAYRLFFNASTYVESLVLLNKSDRVSRVIEFSLP